MPLIQATVGQILTSLNAVTATGAGQDFQFNIDHANELPNRICWEIKMTGGPATIQVDLQASLDDSVWYQADTYSTTTNTMRWVVDKPAPFYRANLVALTGGTSPTVTAKLLATDS